MFAAARSVISNSFYNFVASVAQRLGQTLVFIVIARVLTDDLVGSYKLANTYSSFLIGIAFWGLDQLFIREAARNRDTLASYLSRFLGLRVLFAVGIWAILAVILPFLPYTTSSKWLILIMTLSVVPTAVASLYQSVWIALEDVRLISWLMAAVSIVRAIGGLFIVWSGLPLQQIAWWFLIIAVVEMVLDVWITHRFFDLPYVRPPLDWEFWRKTGRTALPFIVIATIFTIEHQFDVVILSFFQPEAEVGVYGRAVTLLSLMMFVTRSYQLAVFPVLARAQKAGRDVLARTYRNVGLYSLPLAFLMSLSVMLLAEWLILIVYGERLAPETAMLRVLAWVFFIAAFNIPNSRYMIVIGKERLTAYFSILSLAGNVLISIWLVPQFGGLGTAWAKLLSMPLYSLTCFAYVQYHLRQRSSV